MIFLAVNIPVVEPGATDVVLESTSRVADFDARQYMVHEASHSLIL